VNPAIKRARRLAGQPSTASFDLAEALWNAERAQPGSVRQLVAETDLGSRKAYYLLKTWDRFAKLDVSREVLADIGWTKAALIASYAPPGSETNWLELAGEITAKDLEGRLRGGGWGKPKGHSVLLRLSPSQYRIFTRVLRRFGAKPAGKGRGLVDKERALMKALGEIPD
jgi:hypothetical protein